MKTLFNFYKELQNAADNITFNAGAWKSNILSCMSFYLQSEIAKIDKRDKFYICPACYRIEIYDSQVKPDEIVKTFQWYNGGFIFRDADAIKKIAWCECPECEKDNVKIMKYPNLKTINEGGEIDDIKK